MDRRGGAGHGGVCHQPPAGRDATERQGQAGCSRGPAASDGAVVLPRSIRRGAIAACTPGRLSRRIGDRRLGGRPPLNNAASRRQSIDLVRVIEYGDRCADMVVAHHASIVAASNAAFTSAAGFVM
jgi:hypothetical protein